MIQDIAADPKIPDIRGIRGVIGPASWSLWWWVVGLFLLSALCFLLWRKRRRLQKGPPAPPPEPAPDKALRRLQELLATGWLDQGKIKEFYSGLSDVVREYLEGAFKTPALERTTSEILRQLRKKIELSSESQVELQTFLESCDLVKFAKFRPDAAEALKDHALAVRFIEQTKPISHEPR